MDTRDQAVGAVRNVLEIAAVFVVAFIIVAAGWAVVGDDAFARQVVVWVANVAMLAAIWIGLKRRGQNAAHIGLAFTAAGPRALLRALLQSIVILVAALAAFVAGALPFANAAAPQSADMSGYTWLQGNLAMLLIALPAVWFVSSLGEEVVYRGFLVTRIAEIGRDSRRSRAVAVTLSAVIFGLAHFGWGLVGIVQTTLMGLVFATAFLLVRRNLWPLVLAHVWMDSLLLVQLYSGAAS